MNLLKILVSVCLMIVCQHSQANKAILSPNGDRLVMWAGTATTLFCAYQAAKFTRKHYDWVTNISNTHAPLAKGTIYEDLRTCGKALGFAGGTVLTAYMTYYIYYRSSPSC